MKKTALVLIAVCVIVASMMMGCGGGTPSESTPEVTTPEENPVVTPEASTPIATPGASVPEASTPEKAPGESNEATLPEFSVSVQNTEYHDPNQGEWDPVS